MSPQGESAGYLQHVEGPGARREGQGSAVDGAERGYSPNGDKKAPQQNLSGLKM